MLWLVHIIYILRKYLRRYYSLKTVDDWREKEVITNGKEVITN